MISLLEGIYEQEAENSWNLHQTDLEFERKIDVLLKRYMKEAPLYHQEEMKDEIFESVMAMKKEFFLCGFQVAVRLFLECMVYEKRDK